MHEIKVRAEAVGDCRAIDVVHLSAFEGEAEAQLITDLRNLPGYISELSLVAELNGRIVGHILLSKVPLEREGWKRDVFALGPMAVVPSQSHRGIGLELVNAAVEAAREFGCEAIIVAGQPEYYLKCGFKPAAEWGLSSNLPIPEDALTAMELVADTLKGGGLIHYPEAFAAIY